MMNGAYSMNYLVTARNYLQELRHHRNDIVAAYVAGSVARGEATGLSDMLRLVGVALTAGATVSILMQCC
jgi:predicted nucleotidyltransferase